MSDFAIKIQKVHDKIFYMLDHSEESRDCFSKFYFNQLNELISECVGLYDYEIAELKREITRLNKELIFAGLQGDDQQ